MTGRLRSRAFALLILVVSAMPAASLAAAAAPDREAAVEQLIADYNKPGTPGVAVGVFHKGQVVMVKTAGYADIEQDVKVSRQTRFEMASVSKQITGVVLAKLVLAGKLDLDADVRTYLPWVPAFGGAKITPRQLIYHTSGVREEHELCGLAGLDCVRSFRLPIFKQTVMRQKSLNFEPGTRYSYSNTGYMMLGEIVKVVSGKTLREYSDEVLFRPLGMTSFYLDKAGEQIPHQAIGYLKAPGGGWTRETLAADSVGEAGVQATIDDMMKWVGYLSRMPREDPALYRMITAPTVLADGRERLHGWGLSLVDFDGHKSLSYSGGLGGYALHEAYLPDEDLGVVVLTLNGSFECVALTEKILHLYLGKGAAPVGAASVRVPSSLLKDLPGTFLSPEDNWPNGVDVDRLTIVARNGSLHVGTPLDEVEGGDADAPLTFRRDGSFDEGARDEKWYRPVVEGGKVVAIDKFTTEEPTAKFRFVRTPTVVPTTAELAAYEGRYCSEELDICYDIERDGADLLASSLSTLAPIRMKSTIHDRFDTLSWYFVRANFVRDGSGGVTGVNVSSYRALNSFFAKR